MAVSSFFSTITRYAPSPEKTPKEDMLTQAFAALLNTVPGLAEALVGQWTDALSDGSASRPTITPQQRLTSGDRIDLQIELSDESKRPRALIWVEVKHHAHLSGQNQLVKYRDQLLGGSFDVPSENRHLVFLPPAGYAPSGGEQIVEEAHPDWQQVGQTASDWAAASDLSAVEDWLVREFVDYLNEEGLFVSHGFRTVDLEHLLGQEEAAAAFARLVREARAEINGWVEDSGAPHGDDADEWSRGHVSDLGWPEFWRAYGKQRMPNGKEAWLEWHFSVPEDPDNPALGAGLTLPDEPGEQMRQAADANGLEVHFDGYFRVFKYLPLREIAEKASQPSEQVAELVRFVTGAFTAACRSAGWPVRS